MKFKHFDQRNYPIVSAREGYGEWAVTYEDCVPELLDIKVLNKLESVDWPASQHCLDLACGTGRTGTWLRSQGVQHIDGLDITPEMLEQARAKKIYQHLTLGSVEDTDLVAGKYDLVTMCLVDEHLPKLGPVYREAYRVACEGAKFVVVGMHPFFFMKGMPTHYDSPQGHPKAIETNIHLFSHHFKAAQASQWRLIEAYEGVIDQDWVKIKPKWVHSLDCPINYGYVWEKLSQ